MSFSNNISPPEQSYPLSNLNASRSFTETFENDSQANDAFIQCLVSKQSNCESANPRKTNTNFTSTIGSITNRAPSNLFVLKQQRLLAAADRKKRIIARVVSVVGLLIILLCAAIVTLTLKMAPKIDELVRSKAGAHQFIHFVSRINTSLIITTTTIPKDNYTINETVTEKILLRNRQKLFP